MTEPLPTDAAIRAMDGPGLTALAYLLGLAPKVVYEYTYMNGKTGLVFDGFGGIHTWHPHADIDQASAVLRQMREFGYITSVYAGRNFGRAYVKESAMRFLDVGRRYCVELLWGIGEPGNPAEPSEALAILRACVLARAHQQRAGQGEG